MASLRDPLVAKDQAAVRSAGQVLGALATQYRQLESVAAALVDYISSCEHSPPAAAQALHEVSSKFGDPQLVSFFLRWQAVGSARGTPFPTQFTHARQNSRRPWP